MPALQGTMNMAVGKRRDRWDMPDEPCLNIEATEHGETFFLCSAKKGSVSVWHIFFASEGLHGHGGEIGTGMECFLH
jgi:hypothetical protein